MTIQADDLLEVLEGFRALPKELAEMIRARKAREGGISSEERADLLIGTGRLVVVMRQVADEVERVMREYEAEGVAK
jgi:hypothetical protein